MNVKVKSAAIFALVFSGAVMAQDQVAAAKAKPSDEDRIVCKIEKPIGSNIPTRNCMSVAERTRLREQSRDVMTQIGRKTPATGP